MLSGLCGRSRVALGASASGLVLLWRPLWAVLGCSWGSCGRSWVALRASVGGPGLLLAPLWAVLGDPWGLSGRSWAALGRKEALARAGMRSGQAIRSKSGHFSSGGQVPGGSKPRSPRQNSEASEASYPFLVIDMYIYIYI